jgi:ATP-binding cassette subfamily C protein
MPKLFQIVSWPMLAGIFAISGLINVLCLTGSIFMLEVYDRVLPSQSLSTLVGLMALALALYIAQGGLEALRARIFVRVGAILDETLNPVVFAVCARAPLRGVQAGEAGLPLRDLEVVRSFLAAGGPAALLDLPWLPIYVAICFLFHPLIGFATVAGAVALACVTVASELATRGPIRRSTAYAARRHALSEAIRRNAEAVAAMGITPHLSARWNAINGDYLAAQQHVADVGGGLGAVSKVTRMLLQSGALALGAWLVIDGQATGGVMIASSILVSRALAPVELVIGQWRSFVQARQSWHRLSGALARDIAPSARLALPPPRRILQVEDLAVVVPGTTSAIVQQVTFQLEAGQALGVIGASASGKSCLVRALVGVWPTARGRIRLDDASIDQWPRDALGRHIGYMPQEVELFPGSLSENIARFDPAATAEQIIHAARAAGAHEHILRLPEGYDTRLSEGGAGLSAGQRQRIGLARALYADPFLVVLDEPNANLDADGEQALTGAIRGVRARGGVVVVVAHRPAALEAVDLVLMLGEGRMLAFGPTTNMLRSALVAAGRPVPPDRRPDAAPVAGRMTPDLASRGAA